MHYQIHRCMLNPHADYVVFSSGLGGHGAFWQPQINAFQQHFHVVLYDQEGCHAGATHLPQEYSMQLMAEQLLNILLDTEISTFHFIGHALGGHIGIELARLITQQKLPLTMKSLTPINAWNELDPHTQKCFQARISLLKNSGAEAYVRAQALFLYPPQWISIHIEQLTQAENAQLSQFPPHENILARLNALQQFKVGHAHVEALAHIRMHYVANQDDFLVPVQKSADLKQQIGHGQLSIFAQGAHASTHTQTAQINQALLDFLLQS
ncbi:MULTISPECIES: pyrimidine utilization protein D [Acinetobacter]|uniref:Pyrimidine utilization protein D n=1 Tax=Acinetobacter chengduensis TaxID=2420890 RepID=A0ABX9TX33_9GAMM|nr:MULTISPECIES: pyrimidine utilization protein D [Acinetobacter]MBI1450664.1 pyrimidine utilization protein D [Acinetobacter sp. FL51]RKG40751.1 pyrimidine utilization protein D [Acinetobacter sp. WCHAc060007]RLL22152.1 pyrimidine utilization protein D [Acinetobacter chengduensis]